MKTRFHSKRGLTLVELIAAVAIMTVIVGAACAAFYGGAKNAADGAADYASHGDAYLLETWLRKNLPAAVGVEVADRARSASDFSGSSEVLNLHFAPDGDFLVEQSGSGTVMRLSGIRQVVLRTDGAGSNLELRYEITAESGSRVFRLPGGIVLNNIKNASPGAPDGARPIPETVVRKGDTSTYISLAQ